MKKREHSHTEIAKANRAEWVGHAEKELDIKAELTFASNVQEITKFCQQRN